MDMYRHELKCEKLFFQKVWEGEKTSELRKNDRDFQKGDLIKLREIENRVYTGLTINATITHVLQGYIGLEPGYCILSLSNIIKK